ncbi:MAG: hypothetical protein WCY19_08445 [Candidatus Gastranaerophilaceae bacterium]
MTVDKTTRPGASIVAAGQGKNANGPTAPGGGQSTVNNYYTTNNYNTRNESIFNRAREHRGEIGRHHHNHRHHGWDRGRNEYREGYGMNPYGNDMRGYQEQEQGNNFGNVVQKLLDPIGIFKGLFG